MSNVNRQFLLAARPEGMVKETDFEYREVAIPTPGPDQMLIRTSHISLDPSMRGQMENRADYVAPLELGDVMRAGAVGRVVRSDQPRYPEGCLVGGSFGMQDYVVSDGRSLPLRRFDDDVTPEEALGVLGGTGMTAYFGLLDVGQPRVGDTVVVSGAAGATGSIAGQIAKLMGCTVVGIAGGPEKCEWLTGTLGFDAAIDYRNEDVPRALDAHCPEGIDVYFDNVGGAVLDECLARIRDGARVVLCGGISRYNATGELAGPRNYFNLVFRRARMEGFIVLDYAPRFPEASRRIRRWLRDGSIQQRATVVEGFEELPRTLVRLFEGYNIGKLMVQVS